MKIFRTLNEWLEYQKYKIKLKQCIIKYRKYPHKFIEKMYGIKLRWYQKAMVDMVYKERNM